MPSFITLTAHTARPLAAFLIPSSSSSSSSGWMSVCPSPDSCAMLIIFSLPLLNFSCLTLIRSILTGSNREKDGGTAFYAVELTVQHKAATYIYRERLDWILYIILHRNVYFFKFKSDIESISLYTTLCHCHWVDVDSLFNLLSRLWIWTFCTLNRQRVRGTSASQILRVSLSLQLLHGFTLFLQSGSHRLHDSSLKELRPSETQRNQECQSETLRTVSRWQSVTVCSTQQTVTLNCDGGARRSFDLLLRQRCHDWDTSAELYRTSEENFNTTGNLSQYHHNEQIETIFHCLHNECMISYIFPTCCCCLRSVFIVRFESETCIFNKMRLFKLSL